MQRNVLQEQHRVFRHAEQEAVMAEWEDCSRHQIDFLRRENERLLKHGERLIETTSKLIGNRQDFEPPISTLPEPAPAPHPASALRSRPKR
jgi:hypothetical protein